MNNNEVTLFLIEDDDVDAITVERALKKRRIANPMIRAKDGMEALSFLQENKVPKPYITLLDLRLPRMNGIEFLDEIRKDELLHDMVVFVLTTSHDERDIKATYEHNIAGYFIKESAGDELLGIADMLQGYWRIVCLPS